MRNKCKDFLPEEILTVKPKVKLRRSSNLQDNKVKVEVQKLTATSSKLRATAKPFLMPSKEMSESSSLLVTQPEVVSGRPYHTFTSSGPTSGSVAHTSSSTSPTTGRPAHTYRTFPPNTECPAHNSSSYIPSKGFSTFQPTAGSPTHASSTSPPTTGRPVHTSGSSQPTSLRPAKASSLSPPTKGSSTLGSSSSTLLKGSTAHTSSSPPVSSRPVQASSSSSFFPSSTESPAHNSSSSSPTTQTPAHNSSSSKASSSSAGLLPAASLLPQLESLCSSQGWTLVCQSGGGDQASRRCCIEVRDLSGTAVHTSRGVGSSCTEAQGVAARAMWSILRKLHLKMPGREDIRKKSEELRTMGSDASLPTASMSSLTSSRTNGWWFGQPPKSSSNSMSFQNTKSSSPAKSSSHAMSFPSSHSSLSTKTSPSPATKFSLPSKFSPTTNSSPTAKSSSNVNSTIPKISQTTNNTFETSAQLSPTTKYFLSIKPSLTVKSCQTNETPLAAVPYPIAKSSSNIMSSTIFKDNGKIKRENEQKRVVSKMQIQDCEAPILIGHKGAKVNFIENNSGAKVTIHGKKGEVREVVIAGTSAAVELARTMVLVVIRHK